MNNTKGIVFNIQRYSIDDGPGIRTTVFIKGCPLKCLWCSNPESQNLQPEITHRESSCQRCGRCVEVCPEEAVSLTAEGLTIDRNRCRVCGTCVDACETEALKIMGQEMTVEEVWEVVSKDVDYYRNSGGGVTFSGGEPLTQPDFTKALLERCQEAGIHTCLDTSGTSDSSTLEKILPHVSLVYYDLKHTDPEAHRRFTGHSNEQILKNLDLVLSWGIPVVIRIPLIPEINADRRQLEEMAGLLMGKENIQEVHLLPYHKYGSGKYQMLEREYSLKSLEPPTEEKKEEAEEIFTSRGLTAEVKI